MSDYLRVALLSDIHAHTGRYDAEDAPSFLSVSSPQNDPISNPLAGIQKLVDDWKLTADLVICAGDMGDKANGAAQNFVWDQLHALGRKLNAKHVVGTAGNHDVDSRFAESDFDAKGLLQSLSPSFPGFPEDDCDRYWSRNYAILDHDQWRILNINSAAYHGGGPNQKEEFGRGRVSTRTVDRIKADLVSRDRKPLNILLCHHHPVRNDLIPTKDYSEMMGGDYLINMINDATDDDWIVIHGHKHLPRLWYGGGNSGRSPVILSAGSLSVKLYSEIQTRARNQFYIVEFPLAAIANNEIGICGRVEAWDWIYSKGWQPAIAQSGIPHKAGFGLREHPRKVARRIAEAVADVLPGRGYLTWDEVCVADPLLKFAPPLSLEQAAETLKNSHQLSLAFSDGEPRSVAEVSA